MGGVEGYYILNSFISIACCDDSSTPPPVTTRTSYTTHRYDPDNSGPLVPRDSKNALTSP